jgi:hypothetical protein
MTGKRDPLSLHPFAVVASLGAAEQESTHSPADAQPEAEREAVHRRLLALVGRRLDSSHGPSARTERAV